MVDLRGLSRRGFIGASAAAGISVALGAPAAACAAGTVPGQNRLAGVPNAHGALGANFNALAGDLEVRELQIGRTEWIRGFFPVPNADKGDPAVDVNIQKIVELSGRGYRTILALKFPYTNTVMPVPGTPAMDSALAQVDKILAAVLDRVDIIEIGNEPFIESRAQDRASGALNAFYEAVAAHIIAARREQYGTRCRTHLYLGALNRLDLAVNQTAATERWMAFARETPELDGVDIHPHVPSAQAVQPFLDYILPRLRPDQTFLVTEFSLVWLWQAHLSDTISPEFAERYGFDPSTVVWEAIQAAIDDPFPQEQWDCFLSTSPWYESQKHFLSDQVQNFRATGRLAVATYGYRQELPMTQNMGPDKVPWLLNSVFASYTVQRATNGTTGRGYAWIDEFQALQRGTAA
jgi:hypothetical protein